MKCCSECYRFGFQGFEEDPEIHEGSYTTHFRQYDSRIGRWSSVDPMAGHESQIGWSSYKAFYDNPIMYTDPSGGCETCESEEEANYVDERVNTAIRNSENGLSWDEIDELERKFIFEFAESNLETEFQSEEPGFDSYFSSHRVFINGYIPGGATKKSTYQYTSGTRVNYTFKANIRVVPEQSKVLFDIKKGEFEYRPEYTGNKLLNVSVFSTGTLNSNGKVILTAQGENYQQSLNRLRKDIITSSFFSTYVGEVSWVIPESIDEFDVQVINNVWITKDGGNWIPTWTALGLKPIIPKTEVIHVKIK